jgi:hypothetical protein
MTDEEKKAADQAAKAKAEVVAETEAATDEVPTPSQAELDAVKLGEHHKAAGYKTRQAKAN